MGGKPPFAGAASHLRYSGIAVIRGGRCGYTEQMVQQGGELPSGTIWSCATVY
jgi:hypothetical protein